MPIHDEASKETHKSLNISRLCALPQLSEKSPSDEIACEMWACRVLKPILYMHSLTFRALPYTPYERDENVLTTVNS